MKTIAFRGGLAALIVLTSSPTLHATTGKKLHGHVPKAISTLHLQPTGSLPGTNSLRLTIGLPLHNQSGLDELLRQIYDPASTNYHHYLTPDQFTDRFGPTKPEYQAVIDFTQTNGLKIVEKHGNRVLLDVSGAVSDIEKAFHIRLFTYQHPKEARQFYAPDTDPTVDATLPIVDISGLNNYSLPKPMSRSVPAGISSPAVNGSGPGGLYAGTDFRNAYAPGVSLNGTGQQVGLLEYNGYYTNDIMTYETTNHLGNVPLINVPLDGFSGPSGAGGISEVSLDIELAIAMAPSLSAVVVFEAPNNTLYLNDLLNAMAASNQIKQFSSSWGYEGGLDPNTTTDGIYQQMAVQGQSFFQASGDGDAWTTAVWVPADSPYITSVGGTKLMMNGAGASYQSDVVWNSGYTPPAWPDNGSGYWGSGGGVSTVYTNPYWQQGISMAVNLGSTNMRNIPDVALTAHDIWAIYDNGLVGDFEGTSCAAPLWAGFMALVNQQAAANSSPAVGFINPVIYALGKGPYAAYTNCFHDVTNGNNFSSSSPSLYAACPGYDLCTGWGTPNGANLINVLTTPEALQIAPVPGFASIGFSGGPFGITSQSYVLTNISAASLNWTIINTSVWFNVSATNGSLASHTATNVTVSLASADDYLPAGTNSATIFFDDLHSGLDQNFQFSVAIQPLVQNGGFETGDFSDWTLTGDISQKGVTYEGTFNGAAVYAHSGNYFAYFNTDGGQGFLSQSLPTSPDQSYSLSFWLNSTDGTIPNQFSASWNGTVVTNVVNLSASGWFNFQSYVVATGTNTALQFALEDDYSFLALDDVSVMAVAVPAPNFQSAARSGSTLTLSWTTLAGLGYQVEYKTNLLQTNWITLGGLVTATNSTASAPETIVAGQSRFYRVVWVP